VSGRRAKALRRALGPAPPRQALPAVHRAYRLEWERLKREATRRTEPRAPEPFEDQARRERKRKARGRRL